MSDGADSPLWTNPASDKPFVDFEAPPPEELERIYKEVICSPEFKAKLAKRLKPYQTKITYASLHRMLD